MFFFFSSRRRHTRYIGDWSSDCALPISLRMSPRDAEGFYAVHRGRPFFNSLTQFMSSGAAIVLVLEAPDAIRKWRTLMGATDPAKADPGTLRKEFAQSIERNATHGSDASDTAAYEIGYFFAGVELV